MKPETVMKRIFEALAEAEAKFPGFPTDPVHAAAVVAEEAGELVQASLDYAYCRSSTHDRMEKEAAHVGAMAIRFLLAVDDMKGFPLSKQIGRHLKGEKA